MIQVRTIKEEMADVLIFLHQLADSIGVGTYKREHMRKWRRML
ncbi:hypothetical protein ACOI1C_19415 [Bacillus sp. DJP31]